MPYSIEWKNEIVIGLYQPITKENVEDHMKQLKLFGLLFIVVILALAAPTVFAGTPTGASPNDPLMVTGTWQPLSGNSSLWFYFDYSGDKSAIQAT